MFYQFEYRPYQHLFKRPLVTRYGKWTIREGIIIRLTDELGEASWGEIAPLPWFGSETVDQALSFCQQLPPKISEDTIFSIPDTLPACQFGFESAWEEGRINFSSLTNRSEFPVHFSYLLPTGEAALVSWQTPWQQGLRTFKWKISVEAMEEELNLFKRLRQGLPSSAWLRLDANGGLTRQQAEQWLQVTDEVGRIEFIEQPLLPEEFEVMVAMSKDYATPLALDESVATLNQLEECYRRGWRGIFVIKAAIAGSPQRLRQLCQTNKLDVVLSSVFETGIGRQAVLRLAVELSSKRTVGFGVTQWFDEEQTWLERLWG